MDTPTANSCPTCSTCWRLPVLLALVLAGILISHYWPSQPPADAPNAADAISGPIREHVSLSVDFGDGQTNDVAEVGWHQGMTVADLLSSAPGLSVDQKGSGQGAFLTSINGVANQGADGKNWTFAVNNQTADRSFAVYELKSGDRVLWTFAAGR